MPSCPPPMTSVYGCVAHPSFFASRSRFCVHVSRSRLAPCSAPSLPGLSTWGPASREDPKSIDLLGSSRDAGPQVESPGRLGAEHGAKRDRETWTQKREREAKKLGCATPVSY